MDETFVEVIAAKTETPSRRWGRKVLVALAVVWQLAITSLLTLAGMENRELGALAKMLWGVNLLWIGGAGIASIWARDAFKQWGREQPRFLHLKFIAFVTLLALAEEAVTTAMTNCAPLFGVEYGEVYITASGDYLDVVLFHSVIVMIPQFAVWAWLLGRYAISPFAAAVCYGFTGFLNEAVSMGAQPLQLPQWLLIYGLMIYLPANLFEDRNQRRRARWWSYPLMVVLPIFASIPFVLLRLFVLAPDHPDIHFAPMGSE